MTCLLSLTLSISISMSSFSFLLGFKDQELQNFSTLRTSETVFLAGLSIEEDASCTSFFSPKLLIVLVLTCELQDELPQSGEDQTEGSSRST